MCSQACNRIASDTSRFQCTSTWHIPDPDTDNEEESIIDLPINRKRNKSMSILADSRETSEKTSWMGRGNTERVSRVRGYSLEESMKNWHRSSVIDREGEKHAEQYAKMVVDDTLKHLNHTVRVAGSIIEKGTDINNELIRQANVLCKSEHDLSIAEYETDQTTETLRGMTLKGKLASMIKRRKPKMKPNVFKTINVDLLNEGPRLNAFSRMYCSKLATKSDLSEGRQQRQIETGVGQLHEALDVITAQQLDTAWSLQRQEARLSVFENKLDETRGKINHQNEMINKINSKQ